MSTLKRTAEVVAAAALLGRLLVEPTSAASDPRSKAQKIVAGPGEWVVFVKRVDERQYWGRGRITHRAVPFLNTGQIVAVLRARPE